MTVYASRLSPTANTTSTSGNNATYATVRASTAASATSGTSANAGQNFSTPNYSVGQYFLTFNLTTVPAATRYVTLSLYQTISGTGDTLEVRYVSSAAAQIAGASLDAAGPLLGSYPVAGSSSSWAKIVLDIGQVPRTSAVVFCVHSKNQRLNTAPAGIDYSTITTITGTAAQRPYLDIAGPWEFVGVSGVVETTGGTLTLTEPSGVRDGDLLVAMIGSRSTATTAPSATGWTAVGSQNNNNTATNSTGATSSGAMLYNVRSGTPTLGFTIPAGISVAMGRIAAYRGVNYGSVLDASTAVTTAVATTSVSVAGVTTTQDDDLIVAMCVGGQEATWLGFNNLTTGLGISTDPGVTGPPVSAWQERADSITTTGADTSLGIFDAVRPTTGATGNLTVTASLGGGNVVVAGAFKLLRTNATELNPLDKKVDVTLSNNNLTMASAGTANNWVRSTKPMKGRRYIEVTTTTVANTVIGIADLSAMTYPGSNAKSFGMFANGGGSINGTFPSWGPTYASGNVVSMAVDLDAKRVWFRTNGGAWNAGGSADPYTGVGGYDISAYTGTEHYLIVSGDNGVANTVNLGASAFAYTPPVGFQKWTETYGLSAPTPGAGTTLSAPSAGVITVTGAGSGDIWRTIWQMYNLIPGHSYKMEITCSGGGFFQSSSVPAGSEGEYGFVSLSTASNPAYNTYNFTAPAAGALTYCSVYQNVVSPRTTLEYPTVTDLSIPAPSTSVTVTIASVPGMTISQGDETVNLGMKVNVSMLANGMTVYGASPAPPAYGSSQTTTYAARTNTSLNLPGSAAADFQIAIVCVGATGSPPAVTAPGGWTELYAPTEINDGSINRRLYGWYRQWQEGDASPVTFTHSNCSSIASIHAYSNVSGATPVDVQGTASGTGITSTVASLTTVKHPLERLVFVGQDWNTTAGGRNPPNISTAVDKLTGLTWTAGADTAFSVVSDRARATLTANAGVNNPRIYKTMTGLSIGTDYRISGGKLYMGTATPVYIRVCTAAALDSGTAIHSVGHTIDAQDIDFTFTATATTLYFGIIPVVTTIGQYGELTDGAQTCIAVGGTPMTERFDAITYLADSATAAIGATGNAVQTNTNPGAVPWQAKLVALVPGGATVTTGGGGGTSVNVTLTAMAALTITCGDETVVGKAVATITSMPGMSMTLGNESVAAGATAIPVAGGPWTPALATTDMSEWFDAADSAQLVFSGSNLTQWKDKSPAANHATPFIIGPTLTSVNSLGSLAFAAQGIKTTTAISFGDFTVCAVFTPGTGGSYERLVDHDFTNGFWLGRDFATANWGGGIKTTTDPYGIYVPLADGACHQISMKRSSATQSVSGNGNTPVTATVTSGATASNIVAIGTGYDNITSDRFNNEVVSEVLIWSRAVTGDELAKTEGYLAWKWGIQAKLPVGHAYKDAAPVTGSADPLVASVGTVTVSVTVTSGVSVDVTSPASLTVVQGDVFVPVPTLVTVTGMSLSVSLGDVTASIRTDVFASGNFMLITAGTAGTGSGINAEPLAMNALAISLGNETVTGKANVDITGIPLAISQGDESVEGDANATITTLPALVVTGGSVSFGSATLVNVTGMQLTVSTAAPGAITVNYAVRVIVEGFQLTCSIGSSVYVPQASGPIQREGMMKTMANMMGN